MADNKQNKRPNVPPLRFPEFTEPWERKKLSNFTERVTRKNKGQTNLPLTISAQYGLVDQISFFNNKVASADMSNYYLLKRGEFTYNKSYSSDYPLGAVKRFDLYDMGALSTLYICFKIAGDINSDYLVHYFESPKWHRGVYEIAGEGARNHGLLNIAVGDYFETQHYLPCSLKEQEKIASMLNLIQRRIEVQNKLIEQLESLIKGIIHHLTAESPNVRIADCLDCHSSTLQENQLKELGKCRVYGANGVCGYTDSPAINGNAILIVKDGSGIGNVSFATGEYSVIGTSNYLTAKSGYNLRYIYYCLMNFNFAPYKTGMAIPHIYFKDYGKAKIYCPALEEQERIAKILSNIERKIAIERSITDHFNEQKQYLLQRLFI